MMPSMLEPMLGLAALINFTVLLLWFGIYAVAPDWLYRSHNRWFALSWERFAEIHYTGMVVFKILILVFNLAPYLALLILND